MVCLLQAAYSSHNQASTLMIERWFIMDLVWLMIDTNSCSSGVHIFLFNRFAPKNPVEAYLTCRFSGWATFIMQTPLSELLSEEPGLLRLLRTSCCINNNLCKLFIDESFHLSSFWLYQGDRYRRGTQKSIKIVLEHFLRWFRLIWSTDLVVFFALNRNTGIKFD